MRIMRLCVVIWLWLRFTAYRVLDLRVRDGVKMRNSYPQGLYTGVKNLWDSLKRMRKYCMYLTLSIRSILAGEPHTRIARRRCLVLLGVLCVFSYTPNAIAVSTARDVNNYKLYTHIKLLDAKEYRCVELLWTLESRWDPRAKNPKSSAYGIPQILKLKELDPYKQIDAGLKYIKARHLTPCKALAFHKDNGHY